MYKEYSDSYLMKMTKKELIKQLRVAEHNFRAELQTVSNIQSAVKKHRFIAFSQKELHMLERHAIEASSEIVLSGRYDAEEVEMHEALLNELTEALGKSIQKGGGEE